MQLTQVYSQKSIRTTLPRRPFSVSAEEFSHLTAPSSSGAIGASGWQAGAGPERHRPTSAHAHRIDSPAGRVRTQDVRDSLIGRWRTRWVREVPAPAWAKYSTHGKPVARRPASELALIRVVSY